MAEVEWNGYPAPCDPDNFWLDDESGERVNAATGARTRHQCAEIQTLVEKARALYEGSDGDLEIDDDASTSPGEGGTWVAAWVWVPQED
jgi:hypothetical protein